MAQNDARAAGAGMSANSRRLLWWGLSALSLLGGYADLVRGGETIAPMLLVLGYCILVPVAIVKS
jgi:hypothetical protein